MTSLNLERSRERAAPASGPVELFAHRYSSYPVVRRKTVTTIPH